MFWPSLYFTSLLHTKRGCPNSSLNHYNLNPALITNDWILLNILNIQGPLHNKLWKIFYNYGLNGRRMLTSLFPALCLDRTWQRSINCSKQLQQNNRNRWTCKEMERKISISECTIEAFTRKYWVILRTKYNSTDRLCRGREWKESLQYMWVIHVESNRATACPTTVWELPGISCRV